MPKCMPRMANIEDDNAQKIGRMEVSFTVSDANEFKLIDVGFKDENQFVRTRSVGCKWNLKSGKTERSYNHCSYLPSNSGERTSFVGPGWHR